MYDDLCDLCYKDKSAVVAARMKKNWDQEIKKAG